VRENKAVLVLN